MIKNMMQEIVDYSAENDKKFYRLDNLNRDELLTTFIEIGVNSSDDFLKIKETLTRIGIGNRTKKIIYQSCHLLHKKGSYYITSFKELYAMDSKYTEMYEDDYIRRNHIAGLLESWGLVTIKNREVMTAVVEIQPINVYVLPYKEKHLWELKSKYSMGKFLKGKDSE